MKQEVIQDFLNLPGIVGVALMDGRSRPYFCGVDRTLNFQQKEALAQGILQVVATIPEGFESFEFQFTGHQVHIYKLAHGIILLVLTRKDLIYSDYLKTIKDLKAALQEDITNAIATFRLIAANATLVGPGQQSPPQLKSLPNSNPATHPGNNLASRKPAPPAPSIAKSSTSSNADSMPTNGAASTNHKTDPPAQAASVTLKELVTALNRLSQFTTQYLGTHVIVNYWKTTRPSHGWLSHFEINRAAEFSITGLDAQALRDALSLQEQQWVQEWVAAFMKRCSQVIRDFPSIVERQALSNEQKRMLLG